MNNNKMPHSEEAELSIIASVIVDPVKIVKLREQLIPEFFYNKRYELVFKALCDLSLNGVVIDLITLKNQLNVNGSLNLIGDYDDFVKIAEDISIALNVEEYSKIVYEKYLLRETITRAQEIYTRGFDIDESAKLIEYAESQIFELGKMTRSEEFLDWHNLLQETREEIVNLMESDSTKLKGLATNYNKLDKMTNGLQKTDLIILAARPSVGKTAFALNIARNVLKSSQNNNPSVAFFSLEMAGTQLMSRLLSIESDVRANDIKVGNIHGEASNKLDAAFVNMKNWKLHIDETAGIKIGDLKSKARKLDVEEGLDLIIIDYLQLITTANYLDNRQQAVSEISRELKALAKSLKVPIIALSQLSRNVEMRPDKRPMMSDIRESGSIEQDADIIMMLSRPEYYGDNIEGFETHVEGYTELIIAKHRNGETGDLDFIFKKPTGAFKQGPGGDYN